MSFRLIVFWQQNSIGELDWNLKLGLRTEMNTPPQTPWPIASNFSHVITLLMPTILENVIQVGWGGSFSRLRQIAHWILLFVAQISSEINNFKMLTSTPAVQKLPTSFILIYGFRQLGAEPHLLQDLVINSRVSMRRQSRTLSESRSQWLNCGKTVLGYSIWVKRMLFTFFCFAM